MVEVDRIAQLLARHGGRFKKRVFTPGEIAYCDAPAVAPQRYAARFAAKEAAFKALGQPSASPIGWRDLEVVSRPGQPPSLALHGRARQAADAQNITRLHLTITHTSHTALAWILAETETTEDTENSKTG